MAASQFYCSCFASFYVYDANDSVNFKVIFVTKLALCDDIVANICLELSFLQNGGLGPTESLLKL